MRSSLIGREEMDLVELTNSYPRELVKLGYETLERISKSPFPPQRLMGIEEEDVFYDLELEDDSRQATPIMLHLSGNVRPVFGVDTSSIDLGETANGILFAVRGSVVWVDHGIYQYVRHGPFIFHISEKDRRHLFKLLRKEYLNDMSRITAPSLEWISGSFRSILERWLQRQIAESCENCLLLWDGSMTAVAAFNPTSFLSKMLKTARENGNCILAFSKKTKLMVSGSRVNSLIRDSWVPCLVSIDSEIRKQYGNRLRFHGRVYAAKFKPGLLTFRVDIDRKISEDEGIKAVESLISSDRVNDSYPETLRLAHVLSRFSASEVLAMQRYVAETHGLRLVSRFGVRQILFGPYGGKSGFSEVMGRVDGNL